MSDPAPLPPRIDAWMDSALFISFEHSLRISAPIRGSGSPRPPDKNNYIASSMSLYADTTSPAASFRLAASTSVKAWSIFYRGEDIAHFLVACVGKRCDILEYLLQKGISVQDAMRSSSCSGFRKFAPGERRVKRTFARVIKGSFVRIWVAGAPLVWASRDPAETPVGQEGSEVLISRLLRLPPFQLAVADPQRETSCMLLRVRMMASFCS